MPIVKPFGGFRYNPGKFRDFSKLMCPPYDIISPAQQDRYYKKSEFNMIRLILNKTTPQDTNKNNRYTRSAGYLNNWINNNILLRDIKESIYFCRQEYLCQGRKKIRFGFIALLKLEGGKVFGHERTHIKPKADRLKLIKKVKANLSPIFVLYSDDKKYINKIKSMCAGVKPDIKVRDEFGVVNRLWRFDDSVYLGKLSAYMRDKDIFIADGHHRFEVANLYRDMLRDSLPDFNRDAPYNYIMAYFTDMSAENLAILPTHRIIKRLNPYLRGKLIEKLSLDFIVERVKSQDSLLNKMANLSHLSGIFGMYYRRGFYLLRLKENKSKKKPDSLDVVLLNSFILKDTLRLSVEDKNILYCSNPQEAMALLRKESAELVLFMNPTKISQFRKVVSEGRRFPPKSTYFFPKLLSGLVIFKH